MTTSSSFAVGLSDILPALVVATIAPAGSVIIAATVLLLLLLVAFVVWACRYKRVGPDEVLIVSGRLNRFVDKNGKTQTRSFRLVRGGGTFVFPIFEKTILLSLKPETLDLQFSNIAAQKGGRVSVSASAQIRVNPEEPFLAAAAESLAGKPQEEISRIASQIFEGTARATAGHHTPQEACRNQDEFAARWQEIAKPALASLGLEILGFSLHEIKSSNRAVR